jgi:hypothetical protein
MKYTGKINKNLSFSQIYKRIYKIKNPGYATI